MQLAERVLGVDAEGLTDAEVVAEGIRRLRAFWRDVLHLPGTLAGLGIEHPDVDALVHNLHVTKGTVFGNYVKLDASLTRSIYELCIHPD